MNSPPPFLSAETVRVLTE